MKESSLGSNMRKAPLPLLLVLIPIVAFACAEPLAPGSLLVGTWSSADATFTAGSTGASLTIPCIAVHFDPIRLDDSLTFRSTGVVTRAGGLVTVRVGDPFSVTGRVVGNRVVIPYPWIVLDAGADTLSPGGGTSAPQLKRAPLGGPL